MRNRMKKEANATHQLVSRWGHEVMERQDKDTVLAEYPRPVMERENWQCLNGLWKYAFTRGKDVPKEWEGEILVPFSPETVLSGVKRTLLPGDSLWYERTVQLSAQMEQTLASGGHLLLHFGAVDQCCEVFVNGRRIGEHVGGYLPFAFEVGERADRYTIRVRVEDASDTSWHSVGKQTLKPGGMYYPATSGIWQTVWMEAVPPCFFKGLFWECRYDEEQIAFTVETEAHEGNRQEWKAQKNEHTTMEKKPEIGMPEAQSQKVQAQGQQILLHFSNGEYPDVRIPAGESTAVALPRFKSWSPEEPYLYRVELALLDGDGNVLDRVKSYFAMRKCEIGTDKEGVRRIFLNNRPYMQIGVLDQGYWPESLYTAPSDDAMIYDIKTMKELGFNMLRKHVKVEPARWYYHCDRLGMLVWQDMINGGRKNKGWYVTYMATVFQLLHLSTTDRHPILLSRQDRPGREAYERELRQLVREMKQYPSVVCLVPFNEGWGQFDTNRMTALIKELAPDMLVDQASGWFDMGGGDFKSIHYYFFKLKYGREQKRALALTEFGGYARKEPGHTARDKVYGYKVFERREELEQSYEKLMTETVLPALKEGISATVYTQLSDVEEEINGLMTYDREVLKMDADFIRKWNDRGREIAR